MVAALHDVAMTGRVRRSRYEQAEGLSVQQAQRDLRDLVSRGTVQPVGRVRVRTRVRTRFYVAGTEFPGRALELARTPMTLVDPYAAD